MKRLSHYNNDLLDLREYRNYKLDLNYKDTGNDSPDNVGNHTEDPSMNDFIKGYEIEPYTLRWWAKKKKRLIADDE